MNFRIKVGFGEPIPPEGDSGPLADPHWLALPPAARYSRRAAVRRPEAL
ncbi:MAG TPA: hypothetical protein VF329_09165 [Gammaproteobacteria bacterium]